MGKKIAYDELEKAVWRLEEDKKLWVGLFENANERLKGLLEENKKLKYDLEMNDISAAVIIKIIKNEKIMLLKMILSDITDSGKLTKSTISIIEGELQSNKP